MIELEERIATAAEKAPTEDPQIQALREAIARVKEYDAVVERDAWRGRGLHVSAGAQVRGWTTRSRRPGQRAPATLLTLGDNLLRIFVAPGGV